MRAPGIRGGRTFLQRRQELSLRGRGRIWLGNRISGNKAKGSSGHGQHLREGKQMGALFLYDAVENQPG